MPSSNAAPRGSTTVYLLIILSILILVGGGILIQRFRETAPVKIVATPALDEGVSVISPLSGKSHPLRDFVPEPGNAEMVICPDKHKPFPKAELLKELAKK